MEKLTARNIIKRFESIEILCGEKNLDNEINVYGLNRAGLELAGFFENHDLERRVVLFSRKENNYVKTLERDVKLKRYESLIKRNIPLILITSRFKDDDLITVANKLKCPVVKINNLTTGKILQFSLDVFDEYFSPTEEVHASLVNIFGKGVLIKGKSGIGKSETTLELVKKNHLFVGDDRIILKSKNNKLFGCSHPTLKNLIEVRGLGIINLTKIYGVQLTLNETVIDLVIELILLSDEEYKTIDRLGAQAKYKDYLGTKVPIIKLPVTFGRNISELIEASVSKLKLELSGYSSFQEFEQRWFKTFKK
ncbi:HPr(Ser) kinase/phosphatase [Spiroplasma endosymbiont of Anurida maritima]|uniref:HPr(Ser) kinase/phosphatase n=1 Tax=Spiroplasma endosymbiont of Anurida maritima TaxID=2967972 RepID=UPI0036D2CF49